MDVEVSWLAVILAAVANMAVGAIWYHDALFGKSWRKLTKLSEKEMKDSMMKAMVIASIMAILAAYVLAHVAFLSYKFFDVSFMQAALQTGFWLWLGIAATTIMTMAVFERRPDKLTWINTGHSLAIMLVMGAVIGAVGLS